MSVTKQSYSPNSDYVVTVSNARDTNGTLLTSSSALGKVTVTTQDGAGTALVNAASMTYSGTPGTFTYIIVAANMPAASVLRVLVVLYEQTGTTAHLSSEFSLVADW